MDRELEWSVASVGGEHGSCDRGSGITYEGLFVLASTVLGSFALAVASSVAFYHRVRGRGHYAVAIGGNERCRKSPGRCADAPGNGCGIERKATCGHFGSLSLALNQQCRCGKMPARVLNTRRCTIINETKMTTWSTMPSSDHDGIEVWGTG